MPFSDKHKHQVILFNILMLIRYLCPQVTICKVGPNSDDAQSSWGYTTAFVVKDAILVSGLHLFLFYVYC